MSGGSSLLAWSEIPEYIGGAHVLSDEKVDLVEGLLRSSYPGPGTYLPRWVRGESPNQVPQRVADPEVQQLLAAISLLKLPLKDEPKIAADTVDAVVQYVLSLSAPAPASEAIPPEPPAAPAEPIATADTPTAITTTFLRDGLPASSEWLQRRTAPPEPPAAPVVPQPEQITDVTLKAEELKGPASADDPEQPAKASKVSKVRADRSAKLTAAIHAIISATITASEPMTVNRDDAWEAVRLKHPEARQEDVRELFGDKRYDTKVKRRESSE